MAHLYPLQGALTSRILSATISNSFIHYRGAEVLKGPDADTYVLLIIRNFYGVDNYFDAFVDACSRMGANKKLSIEEALPQELKKLFRILIGPLNLQNFLNAVTIAIQDVLANLTYLEEKGLNPTQVDYEILFFFFVLVYL